MVTEADIVHGLSVLGLHSSSIVIVHSSLRSLLLCDDPDCRCFAALQQRLVTLSTQNTPK